jgi:hypothetical protein
MNRTKSRMMAPKTASTSLFDMQLKGVRVRFRHHSKSYAQRKRKVEWWSCLGSKPVSLQGCLTFG